MGSFSQTVTAGKQRQVFFVQMLCMFWRATIRQVVKVVY